MEASQYQCYLTTEPQALTLGDKTPFRQIKKVYFKDSIFDFFPYAELTLQDPRGDIVDNIFFVEGMKFNLKFGTPEVKDSKGTVISGGYIEHQFCWSENILDNAKIDNGICGDSNQFLVSSLFLKNVPATTAYKKSISSIVNDVLTTQLSLTDSIIKKYITTTTNNSDDIWYQAGRTSSVFLKYLADKSYTTSTIQNSNFTTFFNLQNEFYFQNFYDLFTQKSVKTISTGLSETAVLNNDNIRQVTVINMGLPTTFKKYNTKYFKVKSDGSFVNEFKKFNELSLQIDQNSNQIINKQLLDVSTSFENLGVENLLVDSENFIAKQYEKFVSANLPYQMKIEVRFDKNLVSGRIITIDNKKDRDIPVNFISGNWLILKSEHTYVLDGNAYTVLYLAKPSIKLSNKYFYKNNII